MEPISNQHPEIPGWNIDFDPENEPTYPMKKYTGDDHKRLNYQRPPQQPVSVEILRSIERPNYSAVLGTTSPPSGLSGAIRRWAFKHSEDRYRHWIPLILADRINMIEGMIDDIKHGHFPNIIAERGYKAEWKYNKKGLAQKAVGLLLTTAVLTILFSKRK